MGVLTSDHPKCMTEISYKNTILSRQLRLLAAYGVEEVVMTTGYYDKVLVDYCEFLHLPIKFTFVNNPVYDKTNYIYSIYCAKEQLKDDDIVLMHGDLVFEPLVLEGVLGSETSCMTVSSTLPLPEKDFKAVIKGDRIEKVGISSSTTQWRHSLSIKSRKMTGSYGWRTSRSSARPTIANATPKTPSTR